MITSGWQNTKDNGEDFAITPYVFSVIPANPNKYKTYGFGLCWGRLAIFIAYSFNIKGLGFFKWVGKVTLNKK